MQKIPTLYIRDPEDLRHVLIDLVSPNCEWIFFDPDAVARRKFDGTCVMFDGEEWWARREVKPGKARPDHFQALMIDPVTNKVVGWVPMAASSFSKWHDEALRSLVPENIASGTYELCGPKINGDPEEFGGHHLVFHDEAEQMIGAPLDLIEHCRERGWEGVVWTHPDGRRCKLKVRDIPA